MPKSRWSSSKDCFVIVKSSSASASRSFARLARADRPSGMPSCSSRRTWYGPATTGPQYVDSGCVRSNSQTPDSGLVPGALPITTQSAGATTWSVYGALRSGWSKHANPVGGVHAAVQPLAVVAERHHRVDDQLVRPREEISADRRVGDVTQTRRGRR